MVHLSDMLVCSARNLLNVRQCQATIADEGCTDVLRVLLTGYDAPTIRLALEQLERETE